MKESGRNNLNVEDDLDVLLNPGITNKEKKPSILPPIVHKDKETSHVNDVDDLDDLLG